MASEADDLINGAYPADSVSTSDILARIPAPSQRGPDPRERFRDPMLERVRGTVPGPSLPPLDLRPSLRSYDPGASRDPQASRPMDWAERSGVGENAGLSPARNAAGLGELLGQGRQALADKNWSSAADLAPLALGIFAGPRAKTANLPMLAKAKEMAAQGAHIDAIRGETGWHQGKDSQWRFEIPDDKLSVNPSAWPYPEANTAEKAWDTVAGKTGRQPTVGDLFVHTKLEEAYPDFMKVPMALLDKESGLSGGYMPEENMIGFSQSLRPQAAQSVLGHEGMHWIANKEGFAPGSSLDIAQPVYDPSVPAIKKLMDLEQRGSAMLQKLDPTHPRYEEIARTTADVKALLDEQAKVVGYLRDPGEVEARNVQKRLRKTAEQRALVRNAPWRTQDVPTTQQILQQYNEGTPSAQMSVGDDHIHGWHGSPHDFASEPDHPLGRFDLSKMGTGEGAQAYGPGAYIAENRKVGEDYRKKLSDHNAYGQYTVQTPMGGEVTFPAGGGGRQLPEGVAPELHHATQLLYWDKPAKAKALTKEWLADAKDGKGLYPDRGVDYYQRLYDYVRQINPKDIDLKKGRLYEVAVHADPGDFLNWDKTLSKQSPQVREALGQSPANVSAERARLAELEKMRPWNDSPEHTQLANESIALRQAIGEGDPKGASIYRNLADQKQRELAAPLDAERNALIAKYNDHDNLIAARTKMSPEDRIKEAELSAQLVQQLNKGDPIAAQTLGDKGIPGIRYRDAGSRRRADGTHNYSIWTPAIIKILAKYGVIPPAAAAVLADQYGGHAETEDKGSAK